MKDNIFYISRSAVETDRRCPRSRFLGYLFDGRGLDRTELSIPLATGSNVHKGLEIILKDLKQAEHKFNLTENGKRQSFSEVFNPKSKWFKKVVNVAVGTAKAIYRTELETRGFIKEPGALNEFDEYTINEQEALVEALIRAFAIQVVPTLIKEYKIVDIEREEQSELCKVQPLPDHKPISIVLEGKCDAILESRENGEIVLVSFKTSKYSPYDDSRKDKNAHHDLQGITETWLTQARLIQESSANTAEIVLANLESSREIAPEWCKEPIKKVIDWIERKSQKIVKRVAGVQMIYLLKGWRGETPKGSGQYKDASPLIHGWRKPNLATNLWDYAWSYEYPNPENPSGVSRLGKGWEKFDVWDDFEGGVEKWIDLLCSEETDHNGNIIPAIQPECGWCLAKQIVVSPLIHRTPQEIRSFLISAKKRESEIVRAISQVNGWNLQELIDYGWLDEFFEMRQHSCHYPSDCKFVQICYDSEIREHPLAATDPVTGEPIYCYRTPHHQKELEQHHALHGSTTTKPTTKKQKKRIVEETGDEPVHVIHGELEELEES